jgi:hypothetical protein
MAPAVASLISSVGLGLLETPTVAWTALGGPSRWQVSTARHSIPEVSM